MDQDFRARLNLLTPRERECLALVSVNLRSKEIAPILGIEPGTVDITLKRAGRRTGYSDRKALARLLRLHEPDAIQSILQRLGHPQNPLVSAVSFQPDEPVASVAEPPPPSWLWPVPTTERQWNDLSAWQKRLWAILIALGVLASGSVLVAFSRHVLLRAATGH